MLDTEEIATTTANLIANNRIIHSRNLFNDDDVVAVGASSSRTGSRVGQEHVKKHGVASEGEKEAGMDNLPPIICSR